MSQFAGDSEEGLSPRSPKERRRTSVLHTAALSRRRLELEATPASITQHFFLRLKIRSFISRLHVRTSSSASVAPELPPERWMQIWLLLVEDPDDAVREVARQARQIHAGPCTQPAAHSLCIAGGLTPRASTFAAGLRQQPAAYPHPCVLAGREAPEQYRQQLEHRQGRGAPPLRDAAGTPTPRSFGLRHYCRHLFFHYHQPSSISSSTTHLRPRCRRSLSSSR